jgi:adenine-specific DNA-methyltransferase
MIKYIGSKRRLVPVLAELFGRSGAQTALDAFTGTTRVAQVLKHQGVHVTAVDTARYAKVFADCWIATDGGAVDRRALADEIARLGALPGEAGYVTETFCRASRFFQPHNGERIDAIRAAIERDHPDGTLRPLLLTSLLLAADRVDSTAGVQMAYVKQWSARSHRPLEMRVPDLLIGPGESRCGDVATLAPTLPPVDLAYLDPPYNQHRYESNYHVWETLVAWDAPEHYGVACKRTDLRDPSGRSAFNGRRTMPDALRSLIAGVRAEVVVVSYNDESWIGRDELIDMCSERGEVRFLAFDSRRYVGATIGVHGPTGERVGEPGRLRNEEWVVVAGPKQIVERMTATPLSAHQ